MSIPRALPIALTCAALGLVATAPAAPAASGLSVVGTAAQAQYAQPSAGNGTPTLSAPSTSKTSGSNGRATSAPSSTAPRASDVQAAGGGTSKLAYTGYAALAVLLAGSALALGGTALRRATQAV